MNKSRTQVEFFKDSEQERPFNPFKRLYYVERENEGRIITFSVMTYVYYQNHFASLQIQFDLG